MSENKVISLKPHISLNITNVQKSVDFYSKLFGVEPLKYIKGATSADSTISEQSGNETGKPSFGYAKFDVENPPINFVLNEIPFSKGGSLSHLGIQVSSTDDVLKTRQRWIDSGLLTVDEMQVDCCYALQDKTWARDPDGNEWEVFVVIENTEPKDEACACGEKVGHAELISGETASKEARAGSAACCTPSQKAATIGATSQPCC